MRIKITTTDRVGMTLDVLRVFASLGIDILAMEVEPGAIYIRFPSSRYSQVKAGLFQLTEVRAVEEIASLPQEQRQWEIQGIVEAVGEGLVAIDSEGRITMLNAAAKRILNLKAANVIGESIAVLLHPDVPMLATLKTGLSYDNQEIVLKRGTDAARYLSSGRPLKDAKGRISGVVASLKDPSQIRALVHSVTRAPEITFADIVSQSKAMQDLIALAKQVANSDAAVLISGESGTGKELFARSLHAESSRRDGPFVPINCGALPEALLESELFGYEGGAFTGSQRSGRMGLFEFGHRGTVFLDEIAELPTHLQPKLLRALQAGCIRRVGGNEEIQVDVRIIAATNQNLAQLVRDQKFRQDLYYRLNVIPLTILPLRQRPKDIPALVEHFLAKGGAGIAPEALSFLTSYRWPGNVRELENALERALTISGGSLLKKEHFLLEDSNGPLTAGFLKEQVAEFEAKLVASALEKYGTARRAGQALGLSHTSVLNKVKRYGLERYLAKRKE